jgi:ribosomal protein S18 acetylase RimI-like enzyme
MHVAPALRGNDMLEARMIAWAEQQNDGTHWQGVSELVVSADDGDSAYITLLEQHGFVRQGGEYVVLERALADPIPDVPLPEGAIVRHVRHPDEYVERVDAHRDAFAPSRFTLDAYRNVRIAPGYDPELDLVAVLPDGTFVSYCICWWDAVNKRGMFEPVGTRKVWQRQGFGRVVLLEGLRRLRACGALTATVATSAGNTNALRLYESVGLRAVRQGASYVKQRAPQR